MNKVEKKYRFLRFVAWIFRMGAYLSLGIGFVLFFAVLFGGSFILHVLQGSAAYTSYAEIGRNVGAIAVLLGFLFNTFLLYGVGSLLSLLIDLEENTRRAASVLERMPDTSLPRKDEPL